MHMPLKTTSRIFLQQRVQNFIFIHYTLAEIYCSLNKTFNAGQAKYCHGARFKKLLLGFRSINVLNSCHYFNKIYVFFFFINHKQKRICFKKFSVNAVPVINCCSRSVIRSRPSRFTRFSKLWNWNVFVFVFFFILTEQILGMEKWQGWVRRVSHGINQFNPDKER